VTADEARRAQAGEREKLQTLLRAALSLHAAVRFVIAVFVLRVSFLFAKPPGAQSL
jgi:hypothetical protein